MAVEIGVEPLTRAQLVSVARGFETVTLSDEVLARLERQRSAIDALVESGTPVYGLSTGFGSLATTFISPEERRDLQRSLIRSHAAGVGAEVETEVVRAMMVSRLTNLCSGVSGRARLDGRRVRRDVERRHHADRARVRITGLLGRPRAAGARGARVDGRGRRARPRRTTRQRRRRRCARAALDAGRARREGGTRAHQRHRRHARTAGPRDSTTAWR